jgi:hypothetical protein
MNASFARVLVANVTFAQIVAHRLIYRDGRFPKGREDALYRHLRPWFHARQRVCLMLLPRR